MDFAITSALGIQLCIDNNAIVPKGSNLRMAAYSPAQNTNGNVNFDYDNQGNFHLEDNVANMRINGKGINRYLQLRILLL